MLEQRKECNKRRYRNMTYLISMVVEASISGHFYTMQSIILTSAWSLSWSKVVSIWTWPLLILRESVRLTSAPTAHLSLRLSETWQSSRSGQLLSQLIKRAKEGPWRINSFRTIQICSHSMVLPLTLRKNRMSWYTHCSRQDNASCLPLRYAQ